jgi:hypothetical protein
MPFQINDFEQFWVALETEMNEPVIHDEYSRMLKYNIMKSIRTKNGAGIA